MNGKANFSAGAGKCEICYPSDIFPFQDGPDLWTGLHDTPCVRVVQVDCGLRMLFISLEVVLLEREMENRIKELAAELTGIPQDQIWLMVTHTVCTPHFFVREHNSPEENALALRMRANILEAAKAAVEQANETMQDASIGFGCGTCRANINRVVQTGDGWWLGSGEEWPADHSVPVVRIDGKNQKTIAILYNYHCELAVMDKSIMSDGGRHVTADLAGAASRFIENEYDDQVVALFLPGISTDQGPAYKAVRTVRGRNGSYRSVDIKEAGWILLELEGERLGEQVLVAAEQASCAVPTHPIRLEYQTFWFHGQKLRGLPNPMNGPVREWTFIPDADRTRSVEIMVLEDTAFVSVGGIGIETAEKIKQNSPFENTIILADLNGAAKRLPTDGRKYMAEKHMYEKVAFQARNSEFAAGSAEKMLEDVLKFLQDIKENNVSSTKGTDLP